MTQALAIEYLRGKAEEYRRHARSISAGKPADRLLALAQQYETRLTRLQARIASEKSARGTRHGPR
jgi:hypothetical protein